MMIDDMTVKGKFKLHSGGRSDTLYDVGRIVTTPEFRREFQKFIEHETFIVGIEFGGSILAAMSGKPFAIVRKDGTIYGTIPNEYTLVDDVVTTGNSILTATRDIGKEPTHIKCIVNRSESTIKAMWTV